MTQDIESVELMTWKLIDSFGVRQPVSLYGLQKAYSEENYRKIVRILKAQMQISCKINLGLVNKGGHKKAVAWIGIPQNLPLYGTSQFGNTMLELCIKKSFLKTATLELIVESVMHEFSHVVLHATRHELRHSERATDVCAMVLGAWSIAKKARVFERVSEERVAVQNTGLKGLLDNFCGVQRFELRTQTIRGVNQSYLSPEEIDVVVSICKD